MLYDDHGLLELGNREAMEYYTNLIPNNFFFINHSPDKADFKGLHNALYSHHEKIIIVDDEVGFVSGIDLALGRFEIFPSYLL